MTAPLLGLVGRKRSGKDTFASFLTQDHGFVRLAFADRLKDAALAVDPLIGKGDLRLSDYVGTVGWETAKAVPEVRRFLQELGVAVRLHVRADAWVAPVVEEANRLRAPGPDFIDLPDGWMERTTEPGFPVVVTDVRFLNEVQAIRDAGGLIVRIDRPSLPDDGDAHVSEHEWRSVVPDFTVENRDGELDDLRTLAAIIATDAAVGKPANVGRVTYSAPCSRCHGEGTETRNDSPIPCLRCHGEATTARSLA